MINIDDIWSKLIYVIDFNAYIKNNININNHNMMPFLIFKIIFFTCQNLIFDNPFLFFIYLSFPLFMSFFFQMTIHLFFWFSSVSRSFSSNQKLGNRPYSMGRIVHQCAEGSYSGYVRMFNAFIVWKGNRINDLNAMLL